MSSYLMRLKKRDAFPNLFGNGGEVVAGNRDRFHIEALLLRAAAGLLRLERFALLGRTPPGDSFGGLGLIPRLEPIR